MSVKVVREYLKQYGLEDHILTFDVSSATVELAAQAVGCEPARIAKSLTFKVDGNAVMIVAAGDARIDNSEFKAQFHTKATMLKPEEVTELTGFQIGGVCPFGAKDGVKIYLDDSMKRFDTVYPAAGDAASAVKLTLPELEKASRALGWIHVTK